MNEMINKVKSYINRAIATTTITKAELLEEGSIFYMNGNDGTMWDFRNNNHTCEFMVYYKNKYGFIKVFVNANDTIDGYMYLNEGKGEPIFLKVEKLEQGTARKFAEYLDDTYDKNALWDMVV